MSVSPNPGIAGKKELSNKNVTFELYVREWRNGGNFLVNDFATPPPALAPPFLNYVHGSYM